MRTHSSARLTTCLPACNPFGPVVTVTAGAKNVLDLYYWPTPNGYKITMFLEEASIRHTIIPVNISSGEQFAPEFLKISPNNRMPAIVDHDPPEGDQPISVFESGAILLYLADKHRRFIPHSLAGRYEVLQ